MFAYAKEAGAELVGTFLLVFAGSGAIMADALTGGAVGHLGVSLSFGLAVAIIIVAVGPISGAHINPAVTAAFAAAGRFPTAKAGVYVIAQVVGAIAAAVVLKALLGNVAALGATAPNREIAAVADVPPAVIVAVYEFVLSGALMLVAMAVAPDGHLVGGFAALAIGAVVLLETLFAGAITGASMNPARSLGPAMVSGQAGYLWAYVAGPLAGAVAGAFLYRLLGGAAAKAPAG